MELTERAQAVLQRATRRSAPRDRARIVALLEAEGVPVFEPLVAFQERYGGLEFGWLLLGIEDDGVRAFGYDDEDGHYYFYCADDITSAPVNFFLDEEGTFYVGTYPIAERFETYVEWYALVSGYDAPPGLASYHHRVRAAGRPATGGADRPAAHTRGVGRLPALLGR